MKNEPKIKNIKCLRENLIGELESFNEGGKSDKNLERLDVISRTTSAIIRSAKLELEYAKFKGQNPEIEFLKAA